LLPRKARSCNHEGHEEKQEEHEEKTKKEVIRMKERLPRGMVYINVDIPVSEVFRNAVMQEDPELEGLALRLSQLLWEDLKKMREMTDTNEVYSPRRRSGSNRIH